MPVLSYDTEVSVATQALLSFPVFPLVSDEDEWATQVVPRLPANIDAQAQALEVSGENRK